MHNYIIKCIIIDNCAVCCRSQHFQNKIPFALISAVTVKKKRLVYHILRLYAETVHYNDIMCNLYMYCT